MKIEIPYPHKQIALHQLLTAARKTVLLGALTATVAKLDPDKLSEELRLYAPASGRKVVAAAGIRDEWVFVVPSILETRPTLLGYYRLLLGISQKSFYAGTTGLGRFKSMEKKNQLSVSQHGDLPELCKAMNRAMAEMLDQLSPTVTRDDVEQLPLLALGAQFDGAYRNSIGTAATQEVFLAIKELLTPYITKETSDSITLVNSAGRTVKVSLAPDPDVIIEETLGSEVVMNVAVEIKGGTDRSNAHNRAGEAEKSHRKVAKTARDHWTLIALKGLDPRQLATESPTTTQWFDISEILARQGKDWDKFVARLAAATGVPVTT